MVATITETLHEFDRHMESMGYSPNTIRLTGSILRPFAQFVGFDRNIATVNDSHVANFMLEQGRTRQASSMRTSHDRLNVFFTWCVRTGRIKPQQNPMLSRRAPRVVERERERVHVSKFPLLLSLAGESSARDRALVGVGLFTLLRDADMAELRIRDVDLAAGRIRAYISKSRKEDSLVIPPVLDAELRRWFVEYQTTMGTPLQPDWRLLPFVERAMGRASNGRLTREEVLGYDPHRILGKCGRFVRPVLEAVGVPLRDENGKATSEGAHTLRRSGARALYDVLTQDGRADALRIVQTALHHASILQTQHYIGLNPDRETRDTIMRTLRYGFEDVPMIGGGNGDSGEDHETQGLRRMREA